MENAQDHTSTTKTQKWVLASTSIGQMLESMDISFISFAMSSIIIGLHISTAAAGMLSTVTTFGSLLGGILFGLLADRFGRVRILTYTIFIFAISTAGIMFAQNFITFAILRFCVGLGAGGEYGSGVAMVAESFKSSWINDGSCVSSNHDSSIWLAFTFPNRNYSNLLCLHHQKEPNRKPRFYRYNGNWQTS